VAGCVFISYRREDSRGAAGRIYDRLVSRLGRENVFFDVDDIRLGVDFVDVLSKSVGACYALVAVIGKSWASSVDDDNRRCLDDPNDFVRIEIETALSRNIPVIPVFVDGASMPKSEELPDGLKNLRRWNGIEISHTRFDFDAERLTRALSLIEEEFRHGQAAEAERAVREEREKREGLAKAGSEGKPRTAPVEAVKADSRRRADEQPQKPRLNEEWVAKTVSEAADNVPRPPHGVAAAQALAKPVWSSGGVSQRFVVYAVGSALVVLALFFLVSQIGLAPRITWSPPTAPAKPTVSTAPTPQTDNTRTTLIAPTSTPLIAPTSTPLIAPTSTPLIAPTSTILIAPTQKLQ
jgi:hypothetical protein